MRPLQLASYAGIHVTHHIAEFLDAWKAEIHATVADSLLLIGICTPELACRANVYTSAAEPALLRFHVERSSQAAMFAAPTEADSPASHLFSTHSCAASAEYTVFPFLSEALLMYVELGSKVLNDFRLRARCQQQLDYHFSGGNDTLRSRSDFDTLLGRIST